MVWTSQVQQLSTGQRAAVMTASLPPLSCLAVYHLLYCIRVCSGTAQDTTTGAKCSGIIYTSYYSIDSSLLLTPLLSCLSVCLMSTQNKLGDTPLHNAAWKGHAAIVAMLLEKG